MTTIDWGTAGEWFGGVMTAGALGAALWALRDERNARRELDARLERERLQEQERQARRVSFVFTPFVQGQGPEKPKRIMISFEVENESDQTITDVQVEAKLSVPGSGEVVTYAEGCLKLAPGGRYGSDYRSKDLRRDADLFEPPLDPNASLQAGEEPPLHVLREWVTAYASFTDADGRRWETPGPGWLGRADPV